MTDVYETLKTVKAFDIDKDGQGNSNIFAGEMFAINEDTKGDIAVMLGNAYKLGYMRAKGLV